MKDIYYEFVDFDNEESFQLLGKSLGGVIQNKALCFDNNIAKGEIIKNTPHEGLWIRKWKLTVFQKIILHKVPPPSGEEKKFSLIYYLNPDIFLLENKRKKIPVSDPRNNMFLSSDVTMDFSVIPKHPFSVLDIAFTASWLSKQFSDADPFFKDILDDYINKNTQTLLVEPCSIEEYKTLHDLEVSMLPNNDDNLFIRSRVYNLIVSFFSKVINKRDAEMIKSTVRYEQIIEAEMMIMENIKRPPKIEEVARKVNMSVSSLLRHFKVMYGKSINEYFVERKMEFAKKVILENRITVKKMAEMLGYKQASPFIETFTKQYGCSPGTLKLTSDKVDMLNFY